MFKASSFPELGALNWEFKLSQYADDSTAIAKDKRLLHALFNVLSKYQRGSNAKLNLSKTEGVAQRLERVPEQTL